VIKKADIVENYKIMKQYVYVIRCHEYVKIGTTNDTHKRFKDFKTSSPFHIDLICLIEFDSKAEGFEAEGHLQYMFKKHRVSGEWFFDVPEILKYIEAKYSKKASFDIRTIQENPNCNKHKEQKPIYSDLVHESLIMTHKTLWDAYELSEQKYEQLLRFYNEKNYVLLNNKKPFMHRYFWHIFIFFASINISLIINILIKHYQ
jgi:hypothetical protein